MRVWEERCIVGPILVAGVTIANGEAIVPTLTSPVLKRRKENGTHM